MSIPGIAIVSAPQDWQILQRGADGTAGMDLVLAGDPAPHGPGASVQARLVEESTGGLVAPHLDWQDAAPRGDGTYALTLARVPAGGLYRIETRLRRPLATGDRRALRGDCRHHLGVGDLWLIAGQSNASGTGKGEAVDPPELGVHQITNAERWTLATHPVEDATGTLHPITVTSIFHGHSPWLAFARRLKARTGLPVGLIPCALGGSPLERWVRADGSAGDLSANLFDLLAKAGGRAAGVVWYQGESDAFDGTGARVAVYEERFPAWVALIRRHLGDPALPVITAQLNAHVTREGNPAGWTRLRDIQRRLARAIPQVALVPTFDTALTDEVHTGAAGNVAIGERFAHAALALLHRQPAHAAWPEVVAAAWTDASRSAVALTVEGRSGDWTPVTRLDDITVEDAAGPVPVAGLDLAPALVVRLARPAGPGAVLHVHAGLAPRPTLRDDAGRCLVAGSYPLAG